jgi:predicted HAD superfamily hydrolase
MEPTWPKGSQDVLPIGPGEPNFLVTHWFHMLWKEWNGADGSFTALLLVPSKSAIDMLFPDCKWAASIRGASLVSFDVFDTLVARPFADPTDLFEAVGHDIGVSDFRSLRIEAEARARCRRPDREDIYLSDIYAAMADEGLLGTDLATRAQISELRLEHALCGVRPLGRQLYKAVRETNPHAKLVAISDMYLPASEIEQILEANSYRFDGVYVSSEHGVSKHSGNLFDVVRRDLDVLPSDWIHVGDNPWSDVHMARTRGIRVVGVPYSTDAVPTTTPVASTASHDRLGHLALEECAPAAWPDHVFAQLAAHVGAPLIVGMARQVRRDAETAEADTLLFLGRDGYVVEEVYARLYPDDPRRRIRFAGSRKIVGLASVETIDLAALTFLTGCTSELDIAEVLARVAVVDEESLSAARACVSKPDAKNPPIHEVVAAIQAVAPAILHQAARAREMLLGYLRQEGVDASTKTLVVDIGWGCSIQTALSKLLRAEKWSVQLSGSYLGTKNDAPSNERINGWLFQRGLPSARMQTVFSCLEIPELLFAAPEFAVDRLEMRGDRIEPIRRPSAAEEGRVAAAAAMRPILLSVADRVRKLEMVAPKLADAIYSDDIVFDLLGRVLEEPTTSLAEAVSTVGHGQGIGETGHRPIVDPIAAQGTLRAAWRALRRSYWRAGVVAFLPPGKRLVLELMIWQQSRIDLILAARRQGLRGSLFGLAWWVRRQYWRIPEPVRFRIKRAVRLMLPAKSTAHEAVQ